MKLDPDQSIQICVCEYAASTPALLLPFSTQIK